MKARILEDKCIGCGNCVAKTESKVFDFNDDGLASCIVDIIPEDMEELVIEAINECPTEAIEEVKQESTEEA